MVDPKLVNKVVLITGANHAIGAAAARAFAEQGAKVFITYFRDACAYSQQELDQARHLGVGSDKLYRAYQQQSADHVLKTISSTGSLAIAEEADLGKPETIPRLFELCEEKIGPVDILVNNHTYCVLETFDPALTASAQGVAFLSAQELNRHFAVNTRATALMMAEYVKRHRSRKATWGRIINISTDAAHAHVANVSYAASKHAIESYSRSAAQELGKYGITVNIIAPGPIQTGYITPESEAQIIPGIPLGRLGNPEDVADVIVFLASEQARWLTGQLLYVGGGWRMPQ